MKRVLFIGVLFAGGLAMPDPVLATSPWGGSYVATNASGTSCYFGGTHRHASGGYEAYSFRNSGSCIDFHVRVRKDGVTSYSADATMAQLIGNYSTWSWSQHGARPTGSTNIYWGGQNV